MRRRLTAILFDATGTLIDPREPVGETYSRVARDHGVDIPAWRIGDAFGRILRRAPARVFGGEAAAETAALERRWWRDIVRSTMRAADGSVQFENFESFFDALFEHFAGPSAWKLRPDARTVLAALRAEGYRLGIVSNFDYRLRKILQGLEILDFFGSVAIPATCGFAKPDQGIFRSALAELGTSPAQALYVGHHPELDLAAAARAGLHVLDVAELRGLAALPARVRALATLG